LTIKTIFYNPSIHRRRFLFEFSQPKKDIHFQLFSGDIRSTPQTLKVIKAPRIIGSKLAMRFPQYIKKKNTTVSNFGNITVPEGTVLSWLLSAAATDTISFIEGPKTEYFKQKGRPVYAVPLRLRGLGLPHNNQQHAFKKSRNPWISQCA
jgi:hypothetical protein